MKSMLRWRAFLFLTSMLVVLFYWRNSKPELELVERSSSQGFLQEPILPPVPLEKIVLRPGLGNGKFHWASVPEKYPVMTFRRLPAPKVRAIPRIQRKAPRETAKQRRIRLERLDLVRGNFTHAWKGYKKHAWLKDEVAPITGIAHDPFGGWAATLVDSLDTLWIMGLHDEFRKAVKAVDKIDLATCSLKDINVFETTIRYLGGLLGAYDVSGGQYPQLLVKAVELGDMLYKAFDTPNRMPITRWRLKDAIDGVRQEAHDATLVVEIGSLTLEFTRLSQATGDPKFYDAVQRVMDLFDNQQNKTKLPGMWPVVVNAREADFSDYGGFSIGGMADSLYEYLPKQHILLGGGTPQYKKLYMNAMIPIRRHIFYRPMTPNGEDLRLCGTVDSDGKTPLKELRTDPQAQHLSCFAGGMVAIASRIFPDNGELKLARKLVEGCLWAYEVMPLGIMPEVMHTVLCDRKDKCKWNEKKWFKAIREGYASEAENPVGATIQKYTLRSGVAKIDDKRYVLRPEAIESIFILYRITGDTTLRERAWKMFENIVSNTITDIAHASLEDCTVSPNPPKSDRMESFWMAETLKYFYLMFEEWDVVSLDEYVLNTEAHPFKRPTPVWPV